MTSQWSYLVRHYDESNSWSETLIPNQDVDSIPKFTDQGSGEVNTSTIRLNAGFTGKYITQSPIIDQFDKIRITALDGQGGTYDRVYEVIDIIPSEDGAQGTTCQIECLGNEWYLQYIHYANNTVFTETAFNIAKDIGTVYNNDPSTKANGGKLPDLIGHDTAYNTVTQRGNDLPAHTKNVYDYGTTETPLYDVLGDLVDRQGSSVDAGGVLDFFEYAFDTDVADLHKIYARFFSSGSDPQAGGGSLVEIDATNGGVSVNENLDESEGGISAQRATQVLSWGELGSIPKDWAQYLADEVDFIFRPEWQDATKYFVDSKVIWKGIHYKCILEHTSITSDGASSLPVSKWSVITFASEVGNVTQYSPYTDDKVNLWKHMGSDPSGTAGMWDSNLVINYTDQENSSKNFFRTYVDTEDGSGPNPYFFDDGGINNTTPPDGFRFLNKLPNLTGTDEKTGKLFEQSILEYRSDGGPNGTGAFEILYDPRDSGAGMQCANINEGKIYEWNGTVWVDISASSTANDCFHPYSTIENIDGQQAGTPIGNTTKTFTTTNVESAIEVTSTFTTITSIGNSDYYRAFAGLCFAYPFPVKTDASYSERVGELYGNPTTGVPAFFNPQNMGETPDGNRGFNQEDSINLGNVTGLSFFARVKYELGNTTNRNGRELLVANIPIRVTCYDRNDNKVIQDQEISFRNNWEELYFPLNGFKIDRGVVPVFKADSLVTLIRPKEQEVANVFEWRHLKRISIQVQSFFDAEGRFNPLKEVTTGEFLNPQSQVPMFGATVKLAIDAFRWTKRNLATSGRQTERNIEAPFEQRNQIFSSNQLRKDALARAQVLGFRHREYIIGTQGKFDIKFGDSFLYTNPRTVYLAPADRGSDESENTIKLVAKKIEYSMTKANKGKGGFIRRIVGVKRFT